MIATASKTNQYITVTLKIMVVAVAAIFIYLRFTDKNALHFEDYLSVLSSSGSNYYILLVLSVLLVVANWYCEIRKWQIAVSTFKKITFLTATKQSLAALTASLATPNRIGDYGAKALMFGADKRKKVLLLNLLSNLFQMSATVFFGIIGLMFLLMNFDLKFKVENILLGSLGILLAIILIFVFRKKRLLIKGFTIQKVLKFYKKISYSIKMKLISLSILKYMSFAVLFYILLLIFGVKIPIITAFALIFSMYLFVSIIPSIFILDVVVRGGVAIWLFGLVGVPELPILCTVFTMWILNFVLPAIIGSFYVLNFTPETA